MTQLLRKERIVDNLHNYWFRLKKHHQNLSKNNKITKKNTTKTGLKTLKIVKLLKKHVIKKVS